MFQPLKTQHAIDTVGEMTCGLCRKPIIDPPAVWIVYHDPDPLTNPLTAVELSK